LTVNGGGLAGGRAGSALPGNGATREGAVLLAPLPGADSGDGVEPETVVAALVAAGVRVRGFAAEQASLEERFVALTGEGFDVVQ
jgi:ABC-2 type transport system ATP-binding protein